MESFHYQSYHSGIETSDTFLPFAIVFNYQSYHSGIETKYQIALFDTVIVATNRTIVELKRSKELIYNGRTFYQSYHSGIETIKSIIRIIIHVATNRTIVELKQQRLKECSTYFILPIVP